MSRQLDLDYCETHNKPMDYLRKCYPKEFPRRHQSAKNFTHCFGCGEIVAEDETAGGFCKKCQIINDKEVTV